MMDASLALTTARPAPWRFTFLVKLLALAALVALADRLFYDSDPGSTFGLFAASVLLATVALRPELRRHRGAMLAAATAASFAAALFHDPGPLAVLLCWAAANLAVLLPRAAAFGSGANWAFRIGLHSAATPFRPLRDLGGLVRTRPRAGGGVQVSGGMSSLILPVLGTALFLALFAAANPLISEALGGIDPFAPFNLLSPPRVIFWMVIAGLVWRLLRPRLPMLKPFGAGTGTVELPGVSLASVTISLVAFNALFLVQNLLDLTFLWSGAALPEGMTLAEYAHRGAYPLIATALLAGGFVLLTTRPGTPMAQSRLVRGLVTLWIAQNVFLVASTMLRTINYIEAYSLTELRIQALVWMGLVATGLALICVRLWLRRSRTWLVNANLLAVALVLGASVWIDYGRIAAGWNVRHAREVGGRGAALDLCYLNRLGSSALLPLIELETRPLPAALRDRVRWVRSKAYRNLAARQASWQEWTWRGFMRLDEARARLEAERLPTYTPFVRRCDGTSIRTVGVVPPAAL